MAMEKRSETTGIRKDGQASRQSILTAACNLFAEKGFPSVTGKEICEKAGVNAAAVNYYFGSREGLYLEVLKTAHNQMMSLTLLDGLLGLPVSSIEKLRRFLRMMIDNAKTSMAVWAIRIFIREMSSPSPYVTQHMTETVLPKLGRLQQLIHELSGFPVGSTRLQRATGFVLLPCISCLFLPDFLCNRFLALDSGSMDTVIEDMTVYIQGGLQALKSQNP